MNPGFQNNVDTTGNLNYVKVPDMVESISFKGLLQVLGT